jgi:hypothetical protein
MHRVVRRAAKVLGWIVLVLVLLIGLQVSVLAFPSPWFDGSVREGNVRLYYKGTTREAMQPLVREVVRRVQAAEIYQEDVPLRVFVCPEQSLFNLFARLSRVPVSVPGFNLSLLNNSFVSVPRLEERRRSNLAGITHSALSGDLAQCIAHELTHDYMQERLGFRRYRRIPRWKTEGYAEFGATRAAVAADPEAAFDRRVAALDLLMDPRARNYYESALLVAFLAGERGLTFDEIMADSVTREDAGEQVAAWIAGSR